MIFSWYCPNFLRSIQTGPPRAFRGPGAKLRIEASCERSEQKILSVTLSDWLKTHLGVFPAVGMSKFFNYEAPKTLRPWGKLPLLLPPLGGPVFKCLRIYCARNKRLIHPACLACVVSWIAFVVANKGQPRDNLCKECWTKQTLKLPKRGNLSKIPQ